jgi:hypothetical protein
MIATNALLYVVQKEDYEASTTKENNSAEDDVIEISNPAVAQKANQDDGAKKSQPGVAEKTNGNVDVRERYRLTLILIQLKNNLLPRILLQRLVQNANANHQLRR